MNKNKSYINILNISMYIFNMEEESIQCMIRAKTILDNDFKYKVNDEYSKIVQLVEEYIVKHCEHKIVRDLIDIDPDRSKSIVYCENCFHTFSS